MRYFIVLSTILAFAAFTAYAAEEAAAEKGHVATDQDKELVAKQDATYPLKTCVVSGEELGKMGGGVNYIYKDRLVKFCCKGCIKKFDADPAAFLGKIDEAAKKAAEKEGDKAAMKPKANEEEQMAADPFSFHGTGY
jgi:hypothetical protein